MWASLSRLGDIMEDPKIGDTVNVGNASVKVEHPSILNVLKQRENIKKRLSGIKHRIGVYSAKGGVGKTTTAVNLAFALKEMGYKVGLMDADVDCPNLALFLGIEGLQAAEYPLRPVEKDGIKVITTAIFVDDLRRPIIWRGPIIAKMIREFFENTDWGELDYLIIDLPPGTSDAPLSIMQLLELDGFLLVTTPQHVAAVNAIKSGRMSKRMGVSILGVVENMSTGELRGSVEVAKSLECELLGSIKMDDKIARMSDEGKVPLVEDEGIKEEYINIARKLCKRE